MRFDELETFIPYVTQSNNLKKHSQVLDIYSNADWNVRIKQPGKYWDKTQPLGGDGVIEVSSKGADWRNKQFRFDHIFWDAEAKTTEAPEYMLDVFLPAYAKVVFGSDPLDFQPRAVLQGLEQHALLCAGQVLALTEHRRYRRFEKNGGGRFLPLRFTAGIIAGQWTAQQAAEKMYEGLPGLHALEARWGKAPSVKQLALDSA